MAIIISDDILREQELDEQALRVEVATVLYDREVLSLGQAATMAGMNRLTFQKALAERNIHLKITTEDLQSDLETLKRLNMYGRRQ